MSAANSNNGIMLNSYTGGSIPEENSSTDVKQVSIFSSDYKK